MYKWSFSTKAVHSPTLFADIHEYVREGLDETSINWDSETHRTSFVDVVGEWLVEKQEEGKLTQWKVICDTRNNTLEDMEAGNYNLDVVYKQRDCYSNTKIRYTIIKT